MEDDSFFYRRRVMAVIKILREKDQEIEFFLWQSEVPPETAPSEDDEPGEPTLDDCMDKNPYRISSPDWFWWNHACHGNPGHWSLDQGLGHKHPPRIRREVGVGSL